MERTTMQTTVQGSSKSVAATGGNTVEPAGVSVSKERDEILQNPAVRQQRLTLDSSQVSMLEKLRAQLPPGQNTLKREIRFGDYGQKTPVEIRFPEEQGSRNISISFRDGGRNVSHRFLVRPDNNFQYRSEMFGNSEIVTDLSKSSSNAVISARLSYVLDEALKSGGSPRER